MPPGRSCAGGRRDRFLTDGGSNRASRDRRRNTMVHFRRRGLGLVPSCGRISCRLARDGTWRLKYYGGLRIHIPNALPSRECGEVVSNRVDKLGNLAGSYGYGRLDSSEDGVIFPGDPATARARLLLPTNPVANPRKPIFPRLRYTPRNARRAELRCAARRPAGKRYRNTGACFWSIEGGDPVYISNRDG